MEPVPEVETTRWQYFGRHASTTDDMSGFAWDSERPSRREELSSEKIRKAFESLIGRPITP